MLDEIPQEFSEILLYLDKVADEPNPEATPYASLYRVIEILQKLMTTSLSPIEKAIAEYRLGATYLQVEEPHNAQKAFESAGNLFYPALVEFAASKGHESEKNFNKEEIEKIVKDLPVYRPSNEVAEYLSYILESMNQAGILWFNRTVPVRALCYFQACVEYSNWLDKQPEPMISPAVTQSSCTHAYFYLAQVYATFGMAEESSKYCIRTLERQLATGEGFDKNEWLKNCLRLIDYYYLESGQAKKASVCLDVCETILSKWKISGSDEAIEEEKRNLQAQCNFSWLRLHLYSLNMAVIQLEDQLEFPRSITHADESTVNEASELFQNVDLSEKSSTQKYIEPSTINSFEAAREVFLQANAAAEAAKGYFVMDGFVTQHVRILQKQSLLYKRLIMFENNPKRQIAMHLRRIQLLTPILGELNPQAFKSILQEVNYECGEIYSEIHELKSEKGKENSTYALKAVNSYMSFLQLYFSEGAQSSIVGGKAARLPPNVSSMDDDEMTVFLQGYFALARICGKISCEKDKQQTVKWWKQSLDYYEAIIDLAKRFQKISRENGDKSKRLSSFEAELRICNEMVELLPEKINQFVCHGRKL